MSEEGGEKRATKNEWANLILGALFIVIYDIGMLIFAQVYNQLAWAIASIGVVTFVGMLILANYADQVFEFGGGEIRTAIASSVVVVYLVLLSFLTFYSGAIPERALATTIVQNFTTVVEIVVIFYFGSKAVTKVYELKHPKLNSSKQKKKKRA